MNDGVKLGQLMVVTSKRPETQAALIAAIRKDIAEGDTLCGLCPFYQFEHGCEWLMVDNPEYPLPCAELEANLKRVQDSLDYA